MTVLTFRELLKVIFLGIVEGITEWIPISSTGHMLLVDEFLHVQMTDAFREVFLYVIQLGAIFAVILLFWKKMWPFRRRRHRGQSIVRIEVFSTWFKVVLACIPGTIVALLFDDYIEAHLHTPVVIAAALILYGVAFLLVERRTRHESIRTLGGMTVPAALLIGLFQVLSIIPGTSRSGSTILGALLIGVSRTAAAEFTFFLAVPVMVGMGGIKLIKHGLVFTGAEWAALLVGMAVAFVVSLLVVRFLMDYIRRHDFKAFGWYRIGLGIVVLLYFLVLAK